MLIGLLPRIQIIISNSDILSLSLSTAVRKHYSWLGLLVVR